MPRAAAVLPPMDARAKPMPAPKAAMADPRPSTPRNERTHSPSVPAVVPWASAEGRRAALSRAAVT